MAFEWIKRDVAYNGRAFRVARVLVRLPNQQERTFDLVEHADSVSILPLDAQGNLLFVRQYRLGANEPLLELPAGVQDEGEEPAESAAREVREEVGMAARQLIELGDYYLAPGYDSEKMTAFLARDLYPAALDQDEDEFLDVVPIPVAQAYEMAARGEIRDGKSLAALLLARPLLLP